MTAVLLIGLDPQFVDPKDPAIPPGTTRESVAKGIEETLADMQARGWTGTMCAIAPNETAEATIAKSLAQRRYDVVVVGGGIRLPPQHLLLLERVVNAVRRGAPQAAIAFNTSPSNSGDAAARWISGAAG